jgi:uncharacterized protein
MIEGATPPGTTPEALPFKAARGRPEGLRYRNYPYRAAVVATFAFVIAVVSGFSQTVIAAADLPELTQPVNDFAQVIDAASARRIEDMIRALQAKTGDVVVVATVPSLDPYGDINEYAVKLFENRGRGIGQKGKDNGALIVLAPKEHRVRIEVGYDLEQYVTDGYAGETSRMMTPQFANGRYGAGLQLGVERIVGRIAQGRGVTLDGVRVPQQTARGRDNAPPALSIIFWIFIAILFISRISGARRRRNRFWGGGPWSGWSSGVGPFGGGGGWGGGGGGFGGGFGGFGGGRSGGGGGGASW